MCSRLTREVVCVPSENVVAREIEGDMIIVPLFAGIGNAEDELYTLNKTAQAIWQKLDGRKSLGCVADELAEDFETGGDPGTVNADVLGFAEEMLERRILEKLDIAD